ncbi:MAG: glycoside hydrolase family 127 protein [Planctomycetes bacterium]|nr:glycoside hydrolase family 127 protein [Planctomycetota bacterium]
MDQVQAGMSKAALAAPRPQAAVLESLPQSSDYAVHLKANPALRLIPKARFHLKGHIKQRIGGVIEQWVLPAPFSNPAMLEMLRHPDRLPLRNLVPWAGEYAGKYLTHATLLYRLQRSARLQKHLLWFVGEWTGLQSADGYLGPWPKAQRLANWAYNDPASEGGKRTWDTWGHYHAMLGLLTWYRETRDRNALRAAQRIGDLFCRMFLDTGAPLAETGASFANLAPIHALVLLYEVTGVERYFRMALQVEREFELPGRGDYIRQALDGKEFFQTPEPRWESLHTIMALAELYYLTADTRYKTAFERLWWSNARTDRHNNGGFSSAEKAQGDPYHGGAIETCCTVAWVALSIEMLRLTGNPVVADEIELSTLNAGIGMMSPTGRWVTYNTPMDGCKIASPNDTTSFQAMPGQAELNCCSVNGPRIMGMIGEWALMAHNGGLALNYYGPGRQIAPLPSGNTVVFDQKTDYPRRGRVEIAIRPDRPERFVLSLRIPHWSKATRVRVNGKLLDSVPCGAYLRLDRQWKRGDAISIMFDFRLHYWVREDCRGNCGTPACGDVAAAQKDPSAREHLASIFRGPILLAFDPRYNGSADLPKLDAERLEARVSKSGTWLEPWLLLECRAASGHTVCLCDFGSAGAAGDGYRSWLPVRFPRSPSAAFSCENPLRSERFEETEVGWWDE